MKPSNFKYANKVLTKPQSMTDEECSSLYIFTDTRECVSLWKLSWKERLSAIFFGNIWLGILSGSTQPPVWLDCTRTVFDK